MRRLTALLVALPVLVTPPPVRAPVADKVKVVTSLTTYGAIAREIVGDRGIVNSIATGDENPHYVQPKPSFVPLLGQADVFVTTGLDLELWVPALLDKANNQGHGGRTGLCRGLRRDRPARRADELFPRPGRHPRVR